MIFTDSNFCCGQLQIAMWFDKKVQSATTLQLRLHTGRVDVGGKVTAANIMIATGSVPFVPSGIPIDGKTASRLMSLQPFLIA